MVPYSVNASDALSWANSIQPDGVAQAADDAAGVHDVGDEAGYLGLIVVQGDEVMMALKVRVPWPHSRNPAVVGPR